MLATNYFDLTLSLFLLFSLALPFFLYFKVYEDVGFQSTVNKTIVLVDNSRHALWLYYIPIFSVASL